MGVNISVFAKKAKIQFSADRAKVVENWSYIKFPRHAELRKLAFDSDLGLNANEMLEFLNLAKECWMTKFEEEPDFDISNVHYWLDSMIAFVNRHPNDQFFLMTENRDEYWDTERNFKMEIGQ